MKKSTKTMAIFAIVLSIVINYGCPGFFGYNIVGTWKVIATFTPGGGTKIWTIIFAGDKKTGSLTLNGGGWSSTGTYTVKGKNIDFEASESIGMISFSGTINNNEEMSGSGTIIYNVATSSVLNNIMRKQASAATQSESVAFDWVGTTL